MNIIKKLLKRRKKYLGWDEYSNKVRTISIHNFQQSARRSGLKGLIRGV